jgi:hypothetical protein
MSRPERFEAPPKAGLIISGWPKSGQRYFKYTGQIIGEVSYCDLMVREKHVFEIEM